MQDSTFIGLDVHKATISVAVARGTRGGEVRHWGSVPHRPDHIRKVVESWRLAERGYTFAMKPGPAAMVCIASLSRWGMSASSWHPR